jgi:hypothetical protein
MKKMMFILMIMTALLAGNALAVAPADVTNPSFEDGTAGVCDFWTLYSGGGAAGDAIYHEDDAPNANSGDDYFEVGPDGGGWQGVHTASGEEIAVVPGEDYEMVFYAKTADGTSQTASVAIKFEFYATQGEGWNEGVTPFGDLWLDTGGSYQAYNLVWTVPDGMNFARCTVVSGGVAVFVDDVWAGVAGESGQPARAGRHRRGAAGRRETSATAALGNRVPRGVQPGEPGLRCDGGKSAVSWWRQNVRCSWTCFPRLCAFEAPKHRR